MLGALQRRLHRWHFWASASLVSFGSMALGWPDGEFQGWIHICQVIVLPWIHPITVAFLSPVPWQFGGSHGTEPSFVRGLLQAVVFLEFLTVGQGFLDWYLQVLTGLQVSLYKMFLINTLYYVPATVLIGNLIATRERAESQHTRARQETQIAQHRLLQSQLSPHVLFNALNGITELSRVDPGATERCLVALSDLLRKLLKASTCEALPLGEDRILAENYLVLEQLRLGKRLTVEWDFDERLEALRVPPLLLQPLVENAIKHGIAPSVEGGVVHIEATCEGGELRLHVRNTGTWDPQPRVEGIGIHNLRARLDLATQGKARFRLAREGDWTVAEIHIPMGILRTHTDTLAKEPGHVDPPSRPR